VAKKKTSWKTFAGLALAASTWLKLAGDFPITALLPPEDIPPDAPGEPIGEAANRYCRNKFGDLTYAQYQGKLLNLDIDFKEGRLTKEQYGIAHALLTFCRARSIS